MGLGDRTSDGRAVRPGRRRRRHRGHRRGTGSGGGSRRWQPRAAGPSSSSATWPGPTTAGGPSSPRWPPSAAWTSCVNNAGIVRRADVLATSEAEWDRVMAVNVKSVFLMSREAIPHLAARGRRRHRQHRFRLGSERRARRRVAYCASKGAVVNMTRAMAIDHGGQGIRVNAVCPATPTPPCCATRRGSWDCPSSEFLDRGRRPAAGTLRAAGGDRPGGALPGFRRLVLRHRHDAGGGRRRSGVAGIRPFCQGSPPRSQSDTCGRPLAAAAHPLARHEALGEGLEGDLPVAGSRRGRSRRRCCWSLATRWFGTTAKGPEITGSPVTSTSKSYTVVGRELPQSGGARVGGVGVGHVAPRTWRSVP